MGQWSDCDYDDGPSFPLTEEEKEANRLYLLRCKQEKVDEAKKLASRQRSKAHVFLGLLEGKSFWAVLDGAEQNDDGLQTNWESINESTERTNVLSVDGSLMAETISEVGTGVVLSLRTFVPTLVEDEGSQTSVLHQEGTEGSSHVLFTWE